MNSATVPTPVEDVQGDGRWLSMHNRFVREAKEMEPDVVFVGDSLIANLQSTELWEKWFAPMHSLNFGICGDQTQHVLWRLHNGELECILPKAVVVLVGTNNHNHSADEVADGIIEIVDTIRAKKPETYIIVLSILPRGEKHNPLREKNNTVNAQVNEAIKSVIRCQVVEIERDIVLPDGTIDHRDMFDYLHLTQQGYKRAFEPVFELLTQLLHEDDPLLPNDVNAQLTPTATMLPTPMSSSDDAAAVASNH